MPRIYTKILPVRTVVDVVERTPRWSEAADSPTVSFKARVTFETNFTEDKEALWLEGAVQVWPNRDVDILALKPQYGTIVGPRVSTVLDIYEDALRKAFVDTNLNILGVAP